MSISSIIKLMDEHPLEWEFSSKTNESYTSKPYHQTSTHTKTGVALIVRYPYSRPQEILDINMHHTTPPKLGWWEASKLLRAFKRLQRRTFDKKAENYLDTRTAALIRPTTLGNCAFCFEVPNGECFVCGCQAVTHLSCYKENRKHCPACNKPK